MTTLARGMLTKAVASAVYTPRKVDKKCEGTVPQGWRLTQQQQSFIEMFFEDDSKKQ